MIGEVMSRGSTPTVRERPLENAAAAASGSLVIGSSTLTVQTAHRVDLIDLTSLVMDLVANGQIREGLISLWARHTTCALFINEFQTALVTDIKRLLEHIVARDADYVHNDPRHSDCDRFNADSHLRAMLLGHHLTVQVSGGELVLGQWQRILMAELDGPRARSLRLHLVGISGEPDLR
jgi:secondary thiamine-phosphate synthase enzyme